MGAMPNIASILKSEIIRIARKEVKAETESLKKASIQCRSTLASLKRQVLDLERQLKRLSRNAPRPERRLAESSVRKVRYSAKRLAAHRAKLGLSAEAYGALIGVTGQSIYNWEAEKTRPRPSQVEAIAAVRKLGKKAAAAARLEKLST